MNNHTFTLLFAAFFSSAACALGLGDLAIQSHLGEPLRASIKLLDAPQDIQAECFSLQNGNDASLPGVANGHIALESRHGDPLLYISSPQSISEPAIQITVVAGCADHLQRSYVVLLDPPAGNSLPTIQDEIPSATQSDSPRVERKRPKSGHERKPNPAHVQASTRAPRVSSTHRKEAKSTGRSHLILSGGRYRQSDAPDAPLALRLDMSLPDLSHPRPAETPLNPTELSDENTALNHKLAHLESQLASLGARNRALEAMQAHTSAKPPATQNESIPWSRFLIAALLLACGVMLSIGLRRHSRNKISAAPEITNELWIEPEPLVTTDDSSPAPLTPENADHIALAATSPAPENATRFSQSPSADGTEVKEDILDQAEVYVAHGRANLAIHLLQEHLRIAPTESPIPWLLLLDLLARDGLDAEYRTTSIECKRHFNVNLSAPANTTLSFEGSGLEAYPHVLAQLQRVWGTNEAEAFLTDLVYDKRGGTRQGFDPGAYRDIVMLRTIAQEFLLAA